MGELNALVLKGFGYRAERITKEKAYFICETPDGLRMVCKTPETAEHIYFQHYIKEHLVGAGFPWVDRYSLSLSGEPYVCVGGDHYVMTVYAPRREANFSDWCDFSQVLEVLANWHTFARGIPFEDQRIRVAVRQAVSLTDVFRKQSAELASIRKRVSRQARLSDFEVLLIKNAGYYAGQIKYATDALGQTAYTAFRARALSERTVCHNALKEECLPVSGGRVWITQYADACVDVQLSDLCGLIRRYVQRAGVCAVPLSQVLEAYARHAPLPPNAEDILRALLKYPYQFMKIVNLYYSKKRTWTPNAITNRMLAALSERDVFERYIAMP